MSAARWRITIRVLGMVLALLLALVAVMCGRLATTDDAQDGPGRNVDAHPLVVLGWWCPLHGVTDERTKGR